MIFEKVDISHIPKKNRFFDKDKCIGMKLEYHFGEYSGEMEIIDVKPSSRTYPVISYLINGEIHDISQNNIHPYLLKLFYGQYVYQIGDIVNGLEILDFDGIQYTCRCVKDDYVFSTDYQNIKKHIGCPVCSKRVIVAGINDFNTTHKQLMKYLKNKEEGYVNFYGSAKKTICRCPECGYEKEMSFNALTEKGFSCPNCSDGISFGEKYFASFLSQLNIPFETQKIFPWNYNKRYDFYIPSINTIIEIHGGQHYKQAVGVWNNQTLEDVQANDKQKQERAIENNIDNYIIIDVSRSSNSYIKNNIINSKFSELFDLSNIDWVRCHESTIKSKMFEACDLWNTGLTVKQVSDEMHLSTAAIRKYLKECRELGLCDYYPTQGQRLHT